MCKYEVKGRIDFISECLVEAETLHEALEILGTEVHAVSDDIENGAFTANAVIPWDDKKSRKRYTGTDSKDLPNGDDIGGGNAWWIQYAGYLPCTVCVEAESARDAIVAAEEGERSEIYSDKALCGDIIIAIRTGTSVSLNEICSSGSSHVNLQTGSSKATGENGTTRISVSVSGDSSDVDTEDLIQEFLKAVRMSDCPIDIFKNGIFACNEDEDSEEDEDEDYDIDEAREQALLRKVEQIHKMCMNTFSDDVKNTPCCDCHCMRNSK